MHFFISYLYNTWSFTEHMYSCFSLSKPKLFSSHYMIIGRSVIIFR